ncbi:MAG: hypothetical protein RLZZ210_1120 [Pseudomonadota bacterium]
MVKILPQKQLQSFSINTDENANIKSNYTYNIKYNVEQGSNLHQKLVSNPKRILGHFNNIFTYNKAENNITLSPYFEDLINNLISLGHNIDITKCHSFTDINQQLQNIDLNVRFGDIGKDGKITERWHLSDKDIPEHIAHHIQINLNNLGFHSVQNNNESNANPDTYFIFGARCERMYQRIYQTLGEIKKSGGIPDKTFLLAGTRKINDEEKQFLSSLGINTNNITTEIEAQNAIFSTLVQKFDLHHLSGDKVISIIPPPPPQDKSRQNTVDTLTAYKMYAQQHNLPLPQVIGAVIEQPYQRLLDNLVDKLDTDLSQPKFNLMQVAKYENNPDTAPIKAGLNEVIRQFNIVINKLEH